MEYPFKLILFVIILMSFCKSGFVQQSKYLFFMMFFELFFQKNIWVPKQDSNPQISGINIVRQQILYLANLKKNVFF